MCYAYIYLTDGGRDGLWWPALRVTGYPVPDVGNGYYNEMIHVWDTVSAFILAVFGTVEEPFSSCMMMF